jgi:hypothetical protein
VVTFTCANEECENVNIDYNFFGTPENAMCGGCKETLFPTDERPDPEETQIIPILL